MSKREQAMALFNQGYNCAQSVVGAFAEELNLPMDTLMMLAGGLGGGIGRLREVCGAVSGMAVVFGGINGYSDPNATDEKAELYASIQQLAGLFEQRNHSLICRELLGLPDGKDDPTPAARTDAYYQVRPCAELVGDAAEILEQNLRKI